MANAAVLAVFDQDAADAEEVAAELDRLSRRDDAITAAMYGYGVVALLSLVAWCLNQMIRDGAGCGGGKKSTEQRP